MPTAPPLPRTIPAVVAARAAIEAVRHVGNEYAHALAQEAELMQSKPERKMAAVARLMATENPLIPGKAYTCTAADAIVEIDPDYRAFLQQLSKAAVTRELARTEVACAKLTAQLALAALLADAEPDDD
jgi:hypothetical protein